MEKIVLLQPHGDPLRIFVETINTESMQRLVGGWIELLPKYGGIDELSDNGIDLWANEEGKLLQLTHNFRLTVDGRVMDVVCGPVFACGCKDSESVGLTEEQIKITIGVMAKLRIR